jgi:hypothetical protein
MKRILLSAILLISPMVGYADISNKATISSTTCTNETAYISSSTALVGVDVGATSSGGALLIRSSTFTISSVLVSSITLGTVQNHWYGDNGVGPLKGIYYTTTGNAACVTILYKR